MIRRELTGQNGRTITQLTPESQADIDELRRMDEAGELDARHSFADDPERLPVETQDERTGPPARKSEPPFERR